MTTTSRCTTTVLANGLVADDLKKFVSRVDQSDQGSPVYRDLRWLRALSDGLGHEPYTIVAREGNEVVGVLPLVLVKSMLFGRYLVSLPYLNSGGVVAVSESAAATLIDEAVALADQLKVRYLELRHEAAHSHSALAHQLTNKVHMRLDLPDTADALWKSFKPKVRNQVRKAEKNSLDVRWGTQDKLRDFYSVFSQNMRDLGTPVFGRRLFQAILERFPGDAEICAVYQERCPIAAALLVHGEQMTEVPSASSLRSMNHTNANMLMYWHLLKRTVERGQPTFDFGRSSAESSTYRFKKQWGAEPCPAVWQFYVRKGNVDDMRRENDKYQAFIQVWRRLPTWLTRIVGPIIVRGIP